ncbi:MAG: hypothetical protein EZS28_049291, partial [Streblomastix strix]
NKKLAQSGKAVKHDLNQKLSDGQLTSKKLEQETQGGALIACAVCGRTFSPDRIAKHQQICKYINPSITFKTTMHINNKFKPLTPSPLNKRKQSPEPKTTPVHVNWNKEYKDFAQTVHNPKRHETNNLDNHYGECWYSPSSIGSISAQSARQLSLQEKSSFASSNRSYISANQDKRSTATKRSKISKKKRNKSSRHLKGLNKKDLVEQTTEQKDDLLSQDNQQVNGKSTDQQLQLQQDSSHESLSPNPPSQQTQPEFVNEETNAVVVQDDKISEKQVSGSKLDSNSPQKKTKKKGNQKTMNKSKI